MASKAIVAIMAIFALGLLAPSASGMVLPRLVNATAATSNATTVITITLSLQIANVNATSVFQNALAQLQNVSGGIQQEIANALNSVNTTALPVDQLQQFLTSLTTSVQQNSTLAQSVKDALNNTITTLQSEVAKRASELNSAILSAIQGLQSLNNLTDSVAQSLTASLSSLLTNIQQQAAIVNANVTQTIQNLNATLQSGVLNNVLKNISTSLLNLTQNQNLTLGSILGQLGNSSQAGADFVKLLSQTVAQLGGNIQQLQNVSVTLGAGLQSGIVAVVGGLTGLLGSTVGALNTTGAAVVGGLGSAVGAVAGGVGTTVGAGVQALNSTVGAISGAVGTTVGAGVQALNSTVGAVNTAAGSIVGALNATTTAVTGGLGTVVTGVATGLGGLLSGLFGR